MCYIIYRSRTAVLERDQYARFSGQDKDEGLKGQKGQEKLFFIATTRACMEVKVRTTHLLVTN